MKNCAECGKPVRVWQRKAVHGGPGYTAHEECAARALQERHTGRHERDFMCGLFRCTNVFEKGK